MTWATTEIEYEGLPLLLRKPNHSNIWTFKKRLTKLVAIEHLLEKVNSDGLPEKRYNTTLANLDHFMCSFFDKSNAGIIFLIETFSGKRNYYYYTLPDVNIDPLIETVGLNRILIGVFWTTTLFNYSPNEALHTTEQFGASGADGTSNQR